MADFLLEELLRIAQLAGAGAEIEEQLRREIANRPPKGAPQIFHDTDPFAKAGVKRPGSSKRPGSRKRPGFRVGRALPER